MDDRNLGQRIDAGTLTLATVQGVKIGVDPQTLRGEVYGMAVLEDVRLEPPATLEARLASGQRQGQWVTFELSPASANDLAMRLAEDEGPSP